MKLAAPIGLEPTCPHLLSVVPLHDSPSKRSESVAWSHMDYHGSQRSQSKTNIHLRFLRWTWKHSFMTLPDNIFAVFKVCGRWFYWTKLSSSMTWEIPFLAKQCFLRITEKRQRAVHCEVTLLPRAHLLKCRLLHRTWCGLLAAIEMVMTLGW